MAPAVFFMEAPLSDTWVVRSRAAAWKMAPESRSAPVRARGVGFKAPSYHLNAEAASHGVRTRGFLFPRRFRVSSSSASRLIAWGEGAGGPSRQSPPPHPSVCLRVRLYPRGGRACPRRVCAAAWICSKSFFGPISLFQPAVSGGGGFYNLTCFLIGNVESEVHSSFRLTFHFLSAKHARVRPALNSSLNNPPRLAFLCW